MPSGVFALLGAGEGGVPHWRFEISNLAPFREERARSVKASASGEAESRGGEPLARGWAGVRPRKTRWPVQGGEPCRVQGGTLAAGGQPSAECGMRSAEWDG